MCARNSIPCAVPLVFIPTIMRPITCFDYNTKIPKYRKCDSNAEKGKRQKDEKTRRQKREKDKKTKRQKDKRQRTKIKKRVNIATSGQFRTFVMF